MAAQKTPSQKAAAMRAAKMQDNATSEGHDARPVRQAKSNAYKNQVWMTEKNTTHKRVSSNSAESDRIKVPRINQKDDTCKSMVKAPAASALFDSDNNDNVATPSGKSDEDQDSEGDLDKSEDDLKCFKGDAKRLKEALVLEHPQFANRARSKSSSSESQCSHVRMDDNEYHMAHPTLSDGDSEDDLQLKSKTLSHYRTPAVHKKATVKATKGMPSKCHVKNQLGVTVLRLKTQAILKASSLLPRIPDTYERVKRIGHNPISRICCTLLSHASLSTSYSRIRTLTWSFVGRLLGDILLACMDERPEFEAVKSHLMKDLKYVQALASVPEGCISHFRNHVRKVAQVHVASHYGLMKGADTKVADLLKKNMFIYPVNSKDEPICSKPYKAPAILDTIGDAFFGDDTSMGTKFHEKFVSTVKDRTAVRSVIMQYLSEKYNCDFNCELYSEIYKTLVGILNGIFETSKCKYHVLMHSIYNTVYGLKANIVCDLEIDEALIFLDIDAMPDSGEE
ncbi:hypothetical protein EDD22DRAFT_946924 [Suillus occidentalis]|nr:hypothetical protein EDD22DRAFT_946924 [Suillus occidentalis]